MDRDLLILPDQRLGVFVSIKGLAIREIQQARVDADDSIEKDMLRDELHDLHPTRFEVGTPYQDCQLCEIECLTLNCMRRSMPEKTQATTG